MSRRKLPILAQWTYVSGRTVPEPKQLTVQAQLVNEPDRAVHMHMTPGEARMLIAQLQAVLKGLETT